MKEQHHARGVSALFTAAVCMITLAAVVYGFSYVRADSSGTETTQDETDQAVTKNQTPTTARLKADPGQSGDTVFGSEVKREEITAISCIANCSVFGMNAWDVSEKGDQSVMAWIEEEAGTGEDSGSAGLWAEEGDRGETILYLATSADYIVPASCTALFAGYTNVKEIAFNGCFLPQGGDMSFLFGECPALKSIDLSPPFNTTGATGMKAMFYQCESLSQLDLSGWETDEVTDMSFLFYQCAALAQLDLSGWDTGRVENMYAMFYGCRSLKELDVSGFVTRRVLDMKHMFEGCSSLSGLDVSSFRISSDTDVRHMFKNCTGLSTLVLDGFAYEEAAQNEGIFDSCGVQP